jgi:hypothetical protein
VPCTLERHAFENVQKDIFLDTTRGVSHPGLAIYVKKVSKEELWKFKYFTILKYNLGKNPLKETKILQDIIITLELISSFNTSQNISFQKS